MSNAGSTAQPAVSSSCSTRCQSCASTRCSIGEGTARSTGSAFQRRVWRALVAIPAGATASYRDIAERIGAPVAVRAVARACAANRLAVAIPCHRVVRSDGALSGYRWGVERKRRLLACEAAA